MDTRQEKSTWDTQQWLSYLDAEFSHAYEREKRCGYDEKIGTAAIGMLSESVKKLECVGLHGDSKIALRTIFSAMFQAYIGCDLDGEDSSGRSSMGSVFNAIIADLPESFLEIGEDWIYVQRHLELPPCLSG